MLTLRELQAGFVRDLAEDKAVYLANIIKPGKFDANAQFQVYRNNYFISLTDALRAIYISTEKLVGEGYFGFISDKYIRQYPSRDGNLNNFGSEFPAFLLEIDGLEKFPYLSDVASIDWQWHEAFHAAGAQVVDAASLAAVPAEEYMNLHFSMLPSLSFLRSAYSIVSIWQFCRDEEDDSSDKVELRYDDGPEYLLIYRRGLDIQVVAVAKDEYRFLRALRNGLNLQSALERTLTDPELSFDLLQILQNNFTRGLFTDVSTSR